MMRPRTWIILATSALLPLVFALSTAGAQTTANGPYYATPSWDQTLPTATRFVVLSNFGGNAVLDRETGLVWEKAPSTTPVDWISARFQCSASTVGGRKGWRLPSIN